MKIIFAIMFFGIVSLVPAGTQEDESTWFDFWVGRWEATWDEGDGKIGRGINVIEKTLGGSVIQENFRIDEGTSKGYLGTSISVYNTGKKRWHQGYADNKGAFFNFFGERIGDKRVFRTETIIKDEKQIIQRMVFYDIQKNSMTWDWESSEDGGKNWKLNWRINYKRIL